MKDPTHTVDQAPPIAMGVGPRWSHLALAIAGSAWAAFLIPPQLVAWDGTDAPAWAQRLALAAPYDQIRTIAARLGLSDDYALFGSLVAPSFLLIGIAILLAVGRTGRWTRVVGVLTIIGTPVALLSYLGYAAPAPWKYFWGTEALLLLAIGLAAIPAGVLAYRHRRLGGWRAVLLACTIVVLIAGVALLNYWPHGCLVSYGVEVALLATGHVPGGARHPGSPQSARRPDTLKPAC